MVELAQAIGLLVAVVLAWFFVYITVRVAAIAWFRTKVGYERHNPLIKTSKSTLNG